MALQEKLLSSRRKTSIKLFIEQIFYKLIVQAFRKDAMYRFIVFATATVFIAGLHTEEQISNQLPDFDADDSPIHVCYSLETMPKGSVMEDPGDTTAIALADDEKESTRNGQ